jgi:hypothetical protein
MQRQGAIAHHVEVGLIELAVAPLLRPLAAPDLLDLVALERELQLAAKLLHVPRQGHRQIEVQSELIALALAALEAADGVDLLGRLALMGEERDRFDRTRLQRHEPVQFEPSADAVEHLLLDDPLVGQPLREPAEWCDPGVLRHVRFLLVGGDPSLVLWPKASVKVRSSA